MKIIIVCKRLMCTLAASASASCTVNLLLLQMLGGDFHGGPPSLGPKASRSGADAGSSGSQAGTWGLQARMDGWEGSQGAADGARARQAVSHQLRGMLELVCPSVPRPASIAQNGLAHRAPSPLWGLCTPGFVQSTCVLKEDCMGGVHG